jgi:hypothetical protein
MRKTFKIAKKKITFCTGTVDGANCLAYHEDIDGKSYLFWAETKHALPKDAAEALEYIERLGWEIDRDGDFIEN